eukprot:jgi/Chlat1/940/Chrsp108S08618
MEVTEISREEEDEWKEMERMCMVRRTPLAPHPPNFAQPPAYAVSSPTRTTTAPTSLKIHQQPPPKPPQPVVVKLEQPQLAVKQQQPPHSTMHQRPRTVTPPPMPPLAPPQPAAQQQPPPLPRPQRTNTPPQHQPLLLPAPPQHRPTSPRQQAPIQSHAMVQQQQQSWPGGGQKRSFVTEERSDDPAKRLVRIKEERSAPEQALQPWVEEPSSRQENMDSRQVQVMGPRQQAQDDRRQLSAGALFRANFSCADTFNYYQTQALQILDPSDWHAVGSKRFVKKSGWRKLAFFFGISLEIKKMVVERDAYKNVLFAECTARATMESGRFAEAQACCSLQEKRFNNPSNDIPATAETRAKSRACQDLLGVGDTKPRTC